MQLYDLKTNYQENPIGIELKGVTLSWKVKEAKGSIQKTVRIRIAGDPQMRDLVYDSKELQLSECWYSPNVRLEGGLRYYWQVAVTDDTGDQGVSEIAFLEGGHPDAAWTAHWIAAPFAKELHPVFQKSFTVSSEEAAQKDARIYACGVGLYEIYLNGKKVGDEYLAPYYTDYRYWLQTQTYDIAGLLREGDNRLDVYLGTGWYMGKFGYMNHGQLRNYYGDQMQLLLELHLPDGRGGKRILGTDETWLALKSPIISSGIYDGEVYDARMEAAIEIPPENKRLHAVETKAPKAELIGMVGTAVRRHEILPVKEIIHTKAGETVLDFGQEITGWVTFYADVPESRRVYLQYGEVLQDGVFYRENLRSAKAEFIYASKGERQFVRPHFTFYGFRYVKVTGMEVNEENISDFQAWALYSDLAETGELETSNEKVNRLILNTKWSQKDNFLDVPTDCPQRDERLGWTGDAEIFSAAACYHMQTPAFYRKYLKDMRYEQKEKGGAVPYVVPDALTLGRIRNGEPEFRMEENTWGEAGSCVWGDAATVIPWNCWRFYGNRTLLLEEYQGMKQWVDFIIHMDETYCRGEHLWNVGFHFGDWLSLDAEGDSQTGGTDCYYVASMYYMYSAELTGKAAGVLGLAEDAAYYKEISEKVKEAIRCRYLSADGRLTEDTQTAYALGIRFGLFQEEELEQAGQRLEELVLQNNGHLATGFVGTAHLCPALSMTHQSRLAYDLLLNEEYPGWLYEVNLGATTIWERWNSLLPDGSISSTGMNSLNHYAYGVIAEWIYETVCGIHMEETGCGGSYVTLQPQPDRRLDYVKGHYDSMYGEYRMEWRRENETVTFHFEIPFGGTARFLVPDGMEFLDLVKLQGSERIPLQKNAITSLPCGTYILRAKG